jgi:polysaccharide biosynthesis protein VpsM
MNKTIRLALISASIAAVSQAAPFMAVGDGAELFATGVIGVRADDNIYLSKSATSDVIFDLTPGLELDFGKNAQLQGSLTLADDFSLYTDHSNLNTNLFAGDFVSKYDDGKTKMGFNAGYHELNQNTVDIRPGVNGGRLIRRDIGTAGANGEVGISEITAVGGAINYSHENYHPAGYVDSDTLTVPVNFYYKWTPKMHLSLGYQYRNYSVKSGPAVDSNDHFFSVGARGEFTPMLTGKVAVGYTKRNLDVGGDSSLVGIDSSLAYEFSPKTTAQFGLTNDFGTSATGAQQKNLTANVLVTTKLTEEWSANGGVSYRRIQYTGRTDDYWEATVGASYIMSANVRLVGAYVFRTYSVGDSRLSGSEFDNNVFSIAANLRY